MRQFRRDPFEDLRVHGAAGLQLAVAAADEVLGRLVEVREHVEDHPGRLAALQRGAAHQVFDVIVMGRAAVEHP